MEASPEMNKYFTSILDQVNEAFEVSRKAKAKGLDPSEHVEIPLAKNMAERVENLVGVVAPQIVGKGIPDRIQELEKQFGKLDWRVAFTIALEVANGNFFKFNDNIFAMETGIRTGIAYVTNGVVASPLEGFTNLKVKKRKDGKEYLAAFFSGPIRSAGGTGASVSVLIADYVRKNMGYDTYDPTEKEIKRYSMELRDYHERVTNLQYFPSEEETEFIAKNLPIEIDGEPSERMEVSNYKDLDRIETNNIRSGVCLTTGEGLAQKAPKLWKQLSKWGKDFGMDDWNFLEKFIELQKKIRAKGKDKSSELIKPDYNFIKDIVAGRPVITYPMRKGGFRLRYGRSRNTGLSSMGIHPATMVVLNGFIGVGTQLKMERPGKSTALSNCSTIEGPIVRLTDGEVVFLENEEKALKYKDRIDKLLFIGDILCNYGDFFNRAHILAPPGYCEEWWFKELKKEESDVNVINEKTKVDLLFLQKLFLKPMITIPSVKDAFELSKVYDIPLHPRYTYHWKDISNKMFLVLLDWLNKAVIKKEDEFKIILPISYRAKEDETNPKQILEELGIPHKVVTKEYIVIEKEWAEAFMANLGFYRKDLDLAKIVKNVDSDKNVLEIVNKISEVKIKDKSGICIGARMGRPEKAKIRKLTGSPHVLFPVGEEGGRLRCFASALENKKINAEFPLYFCDSCGKETIYAICENCNQHTQKMYYCRECNKNYPEEKCEKHGKLRSYKLIDLDINHYYEKAKEKLNLKEMPELIKGVRGTSNKEHIPENIVKGILRAIHNLNVNKDGTIRYDMTELAITHFRPNEVGTKVEKLLEIGYEKDIYGELLVDGNQVLELKPQDVILPACKESPEEGSDLILFRTANFIDDLLEYYYGAERYYNLKSRDDLVGHLVMGLAPHTSAGIVGRIVGFSNTQGCYAHPLWHCAQRRDCDGDENCVMLLMDGFLNFSKKYLPGHRGATQDAPLVLTSVMVPSEVDDMVFDMDVAWEYPLEFYQACEQYKMPWDVKITKFGDNLGKPEQFEKLGFTHDTENINSGIRYSEYKSLPTMAEKVLLQMDLAKKIRAVDEKDVARLVIERHFIRDIRGNLRKFSTQQFRCVACNEKFRRTPLSGVCTKCGGKIIFTISEGSVIKYLGHSMELARQYDLPPYLVQSLNLTQMNIDSVFGKEKESQTGLGSFIAS